MPTTFQSFQELLGKTPKKGQRIRVGKSGFQEIENVRTTPEGFTIINTSPFIVEATGERQGRGQEIAFFQGAGFVGRSRLQQTPRDFSIARGGTLGAIEEFTQQFRVFPSTTSLGKPIFTVHGTGENFATREEAERRANQLKQIAFGGQRITADLADPSRVEQRPVIDPRFGPDPIPAAEYRRLFAGLQAQDQVGEEHARIRATDVDKAPEMKATGATGPGGQFQEGDTRVNNQTGQLEFLNPFGQWQKVTAPGQATGTEQELIKPGGGFKAQDEVGKAILEAQQARQEAEKVGGEISTLGAGELGGSATEIDQTPPVSPSLDADISSAAASAAGVEGVTPTQEALLKEINRLQKESQEQATGLRGLLEEKPQAIDVEDITRQAFQALGLPADFTKTQFQQLQTTSGEIAGLQKQLANLGTQEQQSLARIEQQAIPMENISNQQRQTQRDFAIKKAGIAAEMEAKTSYLQALQGNFTLANQLVEKTINLATYKNRQEMEDFRWMFDTYKDDFDALEKRERQIFDDLLASVERQTEAERNDLRQKMKLYLDNKVPIPSTTDLQSQSFEEAARFVSANRPPEESVVDVRQKNENLANYIAAVGTYSSREEALADIQLKSTAITLTTPERGLDRVLAEVDRIFPEKPPEPEKPPTKGEKAGREARKTIEERGGFVEPTRGVPEFLQGEGGLLGRVGGFFKGLFGF